MSEITTIDLKRGRNLKIGAIAAPVALTVAPAAIMLLLLLFAAGGPPAAAVIFFFGIIATLVGFVAGLITAAVLTHSRSEWKRQMRDLIAADGIKAGEIDWFKNELRANEKRALAAIEARDLLLGDAYRETLASRLTASRIIRSTQREMSRARKRQDSVRRTGIGRQADFAEEIASDLKKIRRIGDQAKLMLGEAESRLEMIEAAATRGGTLADSELALKRLSARSADIPLALKSARLADEIRAELEKEDELNGR